MHLLLRFEDGGHEWLTLPEERLRVIPSPPVLDHIPLYSPVYGGVEGKGLVTWVGVPRQYHEWLKLPEERPRVKTPVTSPQQPLWKHGGKHRLAYVGSLPLMYTAMSTWLRATW